MDLVHLVKLIVSWEQGEQRNNLEHDAAHAPQIHLVSIVTVRQQTLGRTVPSGRDILCVRLLRVDATTRAEISQLDLVFHKEDVLRLDVSVEDAVSVHVVNGLHQLVHVVLDALFRQVVPPALDSVVHVHLHELEDESKSACWLIVENLVEFDDLRMRGQAPQSLNLT